MKGSRLKPLVIGEVRLTLRRCNGAKRTERNLNNLWGDGRESNSHQPESQSGIRNITGTPKRTLGHLLVSHAYVLASIVEGLPELPTVSLVEYVSIPPKDKGNNLLL